MTPFQKILRLQKKADRHAWHHIGFGSPHPEAIDHFVREGIDARIKKLVKKDNRGSRTKVC